MFRFEKHIRITTLVLFLSVSTLVASAEENPDGRAEEDLTVKAVEKLLGKSRLPQHQIRNLLGKSEDKISIAVLKHCLFFLEEHKTKLRVLYLQTPSVPMDNPYVRLVPSS